MSDRQWLVGAATGGAVALGLIIGGGLVGNGIVNANVGDRTVTVRGLAEKDVKADLAVLPIRFTTSGDVLADAQAKIDSDLVIVRRFLVQQGYPEAAVTLGRFEVTDTQAREYTSNTQGPRYILAQSVSVRSGDVDRILRTSRAMNELVRQGVVIQDFTGPTFIFTKLNSVRPAMIAEATAAARSGAEQFAKDAKTQLGPIKEATQGSFEITDRDGVGDSSQSPDQKVRVVTTVRYQLR